MKPFKIHTVENTTEPVTSILNDTGKALGFVPNLFGVLAESPSALAAFANLNAQFANSSFSPTERELIELTVSTENQCGYCVAGHTAFAAMQGVDEGVVQAVRDGTPIPDERLQTLRRFTQVLVRQRGMVSETEIDGFLDAGYTQRQLLEVILGICVKTFSNLTNNTIGIPLDNAFGPYEWQAVPVRFQTVQSKAA
jgi:uncharacterized peroxidase-related enzyme